MVISVCYVFFDELRGYIRLRQAYLTSPQHRLRASATTVLVTAIPKRWCTVEALDGLYDVFPGGIRNIWLNRNYDELSAKVQHRDKLALALEKAETALIKNAKKAHLKKLEQVTKKGHKTQTKEDEKKLRKNAENQGESMAGTGGISSGNPHQVRHNLQEALDEGSGLSTREQSPDHGRRKVPIVGPGLEIVGNGIDNLGRNVFGGLKKLARDVDGRLKYTDGLIPAGNEQTIPNDGQIDDMVTTGYHNQAVASKDQRGTAREADRDDVHPALRATSIENAVRPGISPENNIQAEFEDISVGTNLSPATSYGSRVDLRPDSCAVGEGGRTAVERESGASQPPRSSWVPLKNKQKGGTYDLPSPKPHGLEEDEFPLSSPSPIAPRGNPQATINGPGSQNASTPAEAGKTKFKVPFMSHKAKQGGEKAREDEYPPAYNEDLGTDDDGEPLWKQYLKEKDRDTMRLPIFGWLWMPSLPLIGKKVDTIDHCRKEVARLNVEIEQDQSEPDKFPLMNSAFVQFNHQVAAHMACQSVSHHMPNQMAPRMIEVSPGDVLWGNMSIRWWERYLRTGVVVSMFIGIIIGWAFPVTFTGLLSQVNYLTTTFAWLRWLRKAPTWVLSIIQGILPQALLGLLLTLLPFILRLLAKNQGVHTGMAVELTVQTYYFVFLFVQVFLVVSISSGITTVIAQLSQSPQSVASILAQNLPKATNYFFSYMLLQALSTSAGALLQLTGLLGWFVLAPILDKTARQKWKRHVDLPQMQWGTFFPVYTNLAAIGLIYSVISPLILVFNIITFSLFWIVYRYNTLYVTKFRFDTGGLLFPRAINQLFTGLYVMELCLIGLFLLVRNVDPTNGDSVGTPCKVQAIIMIIVLLLTIMYQWLLNDAFAPLFRYLPITLEDEAVIRDEEFARAQQKQWDIAEGVHSGDDIEDALEERERRPRGGNREAESIEMKEIEAHKQRGRLDPRNLGNLVPGPIGNFISSKQAWADSSNNRRTANWAHQHGQPPRTPTTPHRHHGPRHPPVDVDVEAQRSTPDPIGEALFSGLSDDIEDLTPEERDKLVRRAFHHEALRAKRPVIWIPRDELGVSDDEIHRTQRFSTHIWISNEYTGVDGEGRVIYRRSPPDFSEVDVIEL